MLIGAHVSPAGGPAKAVDRGVERGCDAIQFFNQSPRAWRPRVYSPDEIDAFQTAMADSPLQALMIHAVYLLNCASEDPEIRGKSLTALISALQAGAALGAHCVVLHPGSALVGGGPVEAALERAAATIAEALAESETCPLHLEDTAGGGATLGRSFEELATLIEMAGGDERLGVCLDSCHLLASGYDVRTAEGLSGVMDEFDSVVGLGRLGSLHLNDSKTPLGSNVDRHADPGEGHLGREGCAAFLSEPRFEDLPCVLELNGPEKKDVDLARELREEGIAARN
ncbi:MAG: deoxyribonuclease [Solirubrobacteraceae bacterium]|jgi:deoxyribonuclease-4|nr:deoxyribonuclease [Solirubrobacteraceae bacterium]